jgi:hypothetical protein
MKDGSAGVGSRPDGRPDSQTPSGPSQTRLGSTATVAACLTFSGLPASSSTVCRHPLFPGHNLVVIFRKVAILLLWMKVRAICNFLYGSTSDLCARVVSLRGSSSLKFAFLFLFP